MIIIVHVMTDVVHDESIGGSERSTRHRHATGGGHAWCQQAFHGARWHFNLQRCGRVRRQYIHAYLRAEQLGDEEQKDESDAHVECFALMYYAREAKMPIRNL